MFDYAEYEAEQAQGPVSADWTHYSSGDPQFSQNSTSTHFPVSNGRATGKASCKTHPDNDFFIINLKAIVDIKYTVIYDGHTFLITK